MSNSLIQILQQEDLIHCYEALSRYDNTLNYVEHIQLREILKPLIVKTNTYCLNLTLSKTIIVRQMKENWECFLTALKKFGPSKTLEIANKVSKHCVIFEMEDINRLNDVLETATLADCYAVLSKFDKYKLSPNDLENFRKFLPSLFFRTETFVSTLSTKKILLAKTMKNDFEDFLNALKTNEDKETSEMVKNLKELWETMDSLLKLNNEKKDDKANIVVSPLLIAEVKEKSAEANIVVSSMLSAEVKEKSAEAEVATISKEVDEEEFNKLSINPLKSIDDVFLDFKLHKSYTIPNAIKIDNYDIVGIDLGTSRCCAAVNRKLGIETVALDNRGERLLPSYVSFDEEFAKCGQIVVDRLQYYSKSTIFDSKRLIGKTLKELKIEPSWPFTVIDEEGCLYLQFKREKKEFKILPVQVSAALLKYIKQKAEEFQGKCLNQAVITVPAVFTEAQRKATAEAAVLAGWKKVHLLPEPIAASFAYFIKNEIPHDECTILIFDLGGGTLNVCIFKIQKGQIKVISYSGDPDLGGNDFDEILINYFRNLLSANYNITLRENDKYKLLLKCQRIKENLSVLSSTEYVFLESVAFHKTLLSKLIRIFRLHVDDYKFGVDEIIKITREEFENMTQPLLNRIRNTINSALYNAEYKVLEINQILQAGGGSRMPMVKKLLKAMFPNSKHCYVENPDEVVAIGAAYYAYNIFSSDKEDITKQKKLESLPSETRKMSFSSNSNVIELMEDETTNEIKIAE